MPPLWEFVLGLQQCSKGVECQPEGFRTLVVNVQLVPKPLTAYEIMRALWDILDRRIVFKNITQHLESRVPKGAPQRLCRHILTCTGSDRMESQP